MGPPNPSKKQKNEELKRIIKQVENCAEEIVSKNPKKVDQVSKREAFYKWYKRNRDREANSRLERKLKNIDSQKANPEKDFTEDNYIDEQYNNFLKLSSRLK